jgi:hypothetical protein
MDKEILIKIKELRQIAPLLWVDEIALKMGKSTSSIYAYCRGDRGTKIGAHKTVYILLKEIIERENEKTLKLIQ